MTADFSPAERLALLGSLAKHTDAENAEFQTLASRSDLDWADVDRLITQNAIRPLTYRHLVRTGLWSRVPVALAEPWAAFSATIGERNQARLDTAGPLFREAAAEGIQIALLKGIHFAPTYYGDIGYKKMNDIDFLMHAKDLDRLFSLYEKYDFFSVGKLLDDEKQVAFSHHTPPFFHRNLSCVLGTHWGLISPLTNYKPDYGAIWQRARPFDFLGAQHWALHPIDNIHHLCIHLPYYKSGLRELADIYNILRAEPNFDWDLFETEVTKAGTAELVWHAMSLVNAILPTPAVTASLQRLGPQVAGFYASDTRHRIRDPRRILYARSTHMAVIDKAFVEFTMTDYWPDKIAAFWGMWGNGFFAPLDDVARFHYLPRQTWYLPLLYPSMIVRIIRYVAKDLGGKIFALLTLKQHIDLWKSAVRTLRGRCKPNQVAVLAAKHDLNATEIATLKNLLE
jgi:hypothetical protein